MQELTGNRSQNVWDEHLHQALVQCVVAVTTPAKHWIIFTEQHQTWLGQPLLRLVMPKTAKKKKFALLFMNPTASYLICQFIRSLNFEHDCTTDEKPATSCCLIDSLYFISLILKTSTFRSWYTCLFAVKSRFFYKVKKLHIVSNIARWTLTGLKQLRFTCISAHHFLEKWCYNVSTKYNPSGFWGMLHCIIC